MEVLKKKNLVGVLSMLRQVDCSWLLFGIVVLFSPVGYVRAGDSIVACVKALENVHIKYDKIKGFSSEQYQNVTRRCQANPATYLSEVRWFEERAKYLPKNKEKCIEEFVGYWYSQDPSMGTNYYVDSAKMECNSRSGYWFAASYIFKNNGKPHLLPSNPNKVGVISVQIARLPKDVRKCVDEIVDRNLNSGSASAGYTEAIERCQLDSKRRPE